MNIKGFVLPSSVTSIRDRDFKDYSGVTDIEEGAFNRTSLTGVAIPASGPA
jgi:hypothetical protein